MPATENPVESSEPSGAAVEDAVAAEAAVEAGAVVDSPVAEEAVAAEAVAAEAVAAEAVAEDATTDHPEPALAPEAEADVDDDGDEELAPVVAPPPAISAITPPAAPQAAPPTKKWYAVHTYSGYEARVRDALQQRVQQFHMEDSFGELFLPSETTTHTLASGKTSVRQKVSLPGYLFVEMVMSEKIWHLVKDTPRVIGFIGNQTPQEVSPREIDGMRRGIVEGAVRPKQHSNFTVGEEVRVMDGAFANFTGNVDDVNEDKQKLKVIVSIFGRPTPVELDFSQVEKR